MNQTHHHHALHELRYFVQDTNGFLHYTTSDIHDITDDMKEQGIAREKERNTIIETIHRFSGLIHDCLNVGFEEMIPICLERCHRALGQLYTISLEKDTKALGQLASGCEPFAFLTSYRFLTVIKEFVDARWGKKYDYMLHETIIDSIYAFSQKHDYHPDLRGTIQPTKFGRFRADDFFENTLTPDVSRRVNCMKKRNEILEKHRLGTATAEERYAGELCECYLYLYALKLFSVDLHTAHREKLYHISF